VAGVCVFTLVSALQARPYLRVLHDHSNLDPQPG
jgi:hypothetical protein